MGPTVLPFKLLMFIAFRFNDGNRREGEKNNKTERTKSKNPIKF
jgi:hypothetical protein